MKLSFWLFFSYVLISSHFGPDRGLLEVLMGTSYDQTYSIDPCMDLDPEVFYSRWSGRKNMLMYNHCFTIWFFASERYFQSLLWGFNPLLMPKAPLRPPYGLILLDICIFSATNEVQISFVNFFFDFINFGHFWPPCAPNWAVSAHLHLIFKVYYLHVE